jgi:type IV fimbrial biogenesis protein FimT
MGVTAQKRTGPMFRRKNRESGFTLVEIMVAVAIVGIVAALAIPNIGGWLARYQLKQAMTEIVSDLNLAKLVAMNRNRQATVMIQMAGSLVQVSGISGGMDVFPSRPLMPRVNGLPGGVATVNFSSLGLSTVTAPQTIQLQNDHGLIYSLSVLPSGNVVWCAKASCP